MPDPHTSELVGAQPADDVLTLTSAFTTVLRDRWVIVWSGVGVSVLSVLIGILTAAFVAGGSFTPTGQGGGLQGLARVAQAIGVDVGGAGTSGPSLDFYVSLMRSRELLSKLVQTRLGDSAANGRLVGAGHTLLEVYGYDSVPSRRQLLRAVERARRDMDISADPASNVISFHVRARSPELAEAFGHQLLDLVNEFNVHQLQSNAASERHFVEDRTEQARRQLQQSDDSLRQFLEHNRSVAMSPRLLFEEQRLQRAIALRQQVYVALAQALEQARIAEVRDTPVITVIDDPSGSAFRSRHVARNGLAGLVIGLAFGILVAFGREHMRLERERYPEAHDELRRLRRETLGPVAGAWRRG